jgi:hypothetical protein
MRRLTSSFFSYGRTASDLSRVHQHLILYKMTMVIMFPFCERSSPAGASPKSARRDLLGNNLGDITKYSAEEADHKSLIV